jgi:IS4 transposase
MIANKLDSFIFNFNNDENKKVKIFKYSTYENKNQEILKYNIDDLNKEYNDRKKYINDIKINITNLIKEIKQLNKENKIINSVLINSDNDKLNKLNELLLENKKIIIKRKKEIKYDINLFHEILEQSYKLNKITINKIKLYNNINDSTYYILTNKLNYNIDKIKLIYKKRWGIEVHFRFSKDKFKFRNMDSKKLHIIEQNLLVTQFIFIIEGYIEFLLLKKIKDNKKINKTSVFDLMEKYIIKFLIISKSNKKNVNKIIKILELIVKNVITQNTINYEKKRIKKRPGSKWINVS